LVVSVQDHGPGIAEQYHETIFDAFTQVDSTAVRGYGGTGLGLNMVRKLVTLMGGTVGLKSELEVGSKFWFEIPIREVV
jgi:signal transduction histidine kinase